jgi:DNA repair exonuclease SbcCD nuclease subunit
MRSKILHTADWHYSPANHYEIKQYVDKIIETAAKEKIDLILISGDLTHSRDTKAESPVITTLFNQIKQLADLAPVAIVRGTLSHDGDIPALFRTISAKFPIFVTTDKPEQYCFNNFLLTQIPQPTKQYIQSIAQSSIENDNRIIGLLMDNIFRGLGAFAADDSKEYYHIVNGHFWVENSTCNNQQLTGIDIAISKDMLNGLNADLICLGHVHTAQSVTDNSYFSGSLANLNYGDIDDKGFFIHNISLGGGADFITVRSSKKYLYKFDYRESNMTDFLASMNKEITDNASQKDYIRCEITLWSHQVAEWTHEKKEHLRERLVSFDFDKDKIKIIFNVRPKENIRCKEVLKADRLRNKVEIAAEKNGIPINENILTKADTIEEL